MTNTPNNSSVESKLAVLNAIAEEVRACTACKLHKGRTKAVPGSGPADADIMFIGEGPGMNEDKQGLPFVGQSGKLLEQLLAKIGLKRDQVFIGNVVKCRPPDNRDPEPDEFDTCTKAYLFRQIEALQPKVIVTLGRFSMGLFFPKAKITAIHGQAKWIDNRAYLPLFHPAAILRTMALMPAMEEDFRKIPELVKEAKAKINAANKPPDNTEPPLSQLTLF
jgi:uracil-DNA glycosylase